MKKTILFIMAVLTMSITFVSCDNSKAQLAKMAAATNAELPKSIGIAGTFNSITYNNSDNTIELLFTLNPEVQTIEDLRKAGSMANSMMIQILAQPSSKEMTEKITAAGANVKCIYQSPDGSDQMVVEITSDEILNEIKNSNLTEEESVDKMLATSVELTNAQCPMAVEEGMIMDKVEIIGNTVVFSYLLSSDFYDLSAFQENAVEIKNSLREEFKDPALRQFTTLCKKSGRSLIYRYQIAGTEDYDDITFTPDEL